MMNAYIGTLDIFGSSWEYVMGLDGDEYDLFWMKVSFRFFSYDHN